MAKATQIVHWPGKDTAACDVHANQLKALANMLIGFLSVTPCGDGIECDNCKNEDEMQK